MARVFRQDDLSKLIGHLDDPHCRGPLPPEQRYVEFPAWRLHPDDPWRHTEIQITSNANQEIDLLLRHDEVDFIRTHPSFRAP